MGLLVHINHLPRSVSWLILKNGFYFLLKVLQNLHQRVGQIHYGFTQSVLRIDRRAGKPRQQHNSSLCQACQEGGICFEGIN